MTDDEKEIRALIACWSRAVVEKDPDAIVANYASDAVFFDAIPPAKTIGSAAIRDAWARCFPHFPEEFRSEHRDLEIVVSGDAAFALGFHHFAPKEAGHPCGSTWMRVTACFRREAGKWKVFHEHVSAPFDPMTGKAVMTPTL